MKKNKNSILLFLFIFFTFFIFISYSNEIITINAKIDPLTIYVDEEFKIIVTIESNHPINIEEYPSFAKIKAVKQIKEPEFQQKYEVQFLNYKIVEKYTVTITFYLLAEEEENILGTSFKFKINNNYHVLKDFIIPIISRSNNLLSLKENYLLSFIYEPKEIFIGQPFECEWIIFSKQDIEKITMINIPQIIGAVYQKIAIQNNKETLSIFDEQINKYTVLKLLVFPQNESFVFFDKFDIEIKYYEDNELKEIKQTFVAKKVFIKELPYFNPNFFGLIGEYSVSFNYNRIESKNSIFYILEIVLNGNGNHKYVDFKKLKINQMDFNVIGPQIEQDDSKVVLTYFLYPKQTGYISFNHINISIFDPSKNDYDNIIIPKSYVYINELLEVVLNNFNFSKTNYLIEKRKISNLFDFLEILPLEIFLIFFILFIMLFIAIIYLFQNIKAESTTELNKDKNIITLWDQFIKINNIKDENELEIFINKQNYKTGQLIIETFNYYKSNFSENHKSINQKDKIKLSQKFYKFLKKNKK